MFFQAHSVAGAWGGQLFAIKKLGSLGSPGSPIPILSQDWFIIPHYIGMGEPGEPSNLPPAQAVAITSTPHAHYTGCRDL